MSRSQKAKGSKIQNFSFDWNIPSFLSLPKVTRQLDEDTRKEVTIVPADSPITGSVVVSNAGGKPLAYDSVVIELQGVVETNEESSHRLPFFTVAKIAKGAGTLAYPEAFAFDFSGNSLPCETINAQDAAFSIKYFISCTLKTKTGNYTGDLEFACMKYLPKPMDTIPIRTEIGVEDTLQLELELCNTFLDISRDMLIGRVHFVHAAKKLEEMAIIIRRRELFKKHKNSDEWFASAWHDIHYYDIMEGAPTREEVIPFRMYMPNLQLSPSFSTDIAKMEYAAVLSLIDSEGRSYFRSHELTLYRGFPDGMEGKTTQVSIQKQSEAPGAHMYQEGYTNVQVQGNQGAQGGMYGDYSANQGMIGQQQAQAGPFGAPPTQYGGYDASASGNPYGAPATTQSYGAPAASQSYSAPASGLSYGAGPTYGAPYNTQQQQQQQQQSAQQPGAPSLNQGLDSSASSSQYVYGSQSAGAQPPRTSSAFVNPADSSQSGQMNMGPYGPPTQQSMPYNSVGAGPYDVGASNPYGAPAASNAQNPYGGQGYGSNPYASTGQGW